MSISSSLTVSLPSAYGVCDSQAAEIVRLNMRIKELEAHQSSTSSSLPLSSSPSNSVDAHTPTLQTSFLRAGLAENKQNKEVGKSAAKSQMKHCRDCKFALPRARFSSNQWRKQSPRCSTCVQGRIHSPSSPLPPSSASAPFSPSRTMSVGGLGCCSRSACTLARMVP